MVSKYKTSGWFIENPDGAISELLEEHSVPYSLRPNFVESPIKIGIQAMAEEYNGAEAATVTYVLNTNGYVFFSLSVDWFLSPATLKRAIGGYRIFTPTGWLHSTISDDTLKSNIVVEARLALDRMLKTYYIDKRGLK